LMSHLFKQTRDQALIDEIVFGYKHAQAGDVTCLLLDLGPLSITNGTYPLPNPISIARLNPLGGY
jgi:hypothetical protein